MTDDEAAAVRAIRAGCNNAAFHLICSYPDCTCSQFPIGVRAALTAYRAGPLPRAVRIAALRRDREPTEAMIRASVDLEQYFNDGRPSPIDYWRAMNDARLAELEREEGGDG
jgi:hypothetical protein